MIRNAVVTDRNIEPF